MEETENTDPDYTKGFNEGYLMARYDPELASKLVATKAGGSRMEGLRDGIEEYTLEQAKNRRPDFLKKDRLSSVNKGKDNKEKEIDKD